MSIAEHEEQHETDRSLWRVVYVSQAVAAFEPEPGLDAILEVSRSRNAARGITGVLVYHGGCFIQVLEGRRIGVHEIYASIQADPRHHGITTLVDTVAGERQFGDWSMARLRIDQRRTYHLEELQHLVAAYHGGTAESETGLLASLLLEFRHQLT